MSDEVVKKKGDAAETPKSASKRDDGPALLHKVHLDPATGFGIFVPGLFVMALGGAMTWHWIFNIGSAIMLAGMSYVVAAIMLTALQQRAEKKRGSGGAAASAG